MNPVEILEAAIKIVVGLFGMMPESNASKAADILKRIHAGEEPEGVARDVVELGLDLVPIETLAKHLAASARYRANIVADELERRKFGGG